MASRHGDKKSADALTPRDMITLLRAEINRKGIAGHHLRSMNSFYQVGIKQIAMKIFTIEGRMRNMRDKTEEDREIDELLYDVKVTDINLTPPTVTKYKSGNVEMLMPNMARMRSITYSSPVFVDIDIAMTAHFKNGTQKTRTATIKNHKIASIPCMVGSQLCNTYGCSVETLKNIEEDPRSEQAVFIINGGEWSIDNSENVANNILQCYKTNYKKELVRVSYLSKPGDAYENSYYLNIRYMQNGAITVDMVTNKFENFEIPFYLLYRMLGMASDRDIADTIVYGVDNEDQATQMMMQILDRAFSAPDEKFGPIMQSTQPVEIIQFVAQKINEASAVSVARKDDNVAKYLNTNVMQIIDWKFFPHIGTTAAERIRKLRFLGHCINILLKTHLDIVKETDRDSFVNKRVFAAGTSMAKAFKTHYNFAVAQEIKKQVIRTLRSTTFSDIDLAGTIKQAINKDDLENGLVKSITQGNKEIMIKRKLVQNRISSQIVYHKNDLNVKSTLNTISMPTKSASKSTDRADKMRRVHPTSCGFICATQSPDTSESVGANKQLACSASITSASSSYIMKELLLSDPDVVPLDALTSKEVGQMAKVFVNGDWIGCCKFAHVLAARYREKRRAGEIHWQTTVAWKILTREIEFWTDVGRLMRPLVIVYNNQKDYEEAARAGTPIPWRSWIRLTKQDIRDLQTEKITIEDLRRRGVIEYITVEEQIGLLLCPSIDQFERTKDSVRDNWTHVDIPQAMLGIVALASPAANHTNTVRNTMYTNHRKQSCGWYNLAWVYRIDKNMTMQHYCDRPLVSTFTDALTYPNGCSTIVAMATHDGKFQEDSIEVNRSSVDCGWMNASQYNYVKTKLDPGEQFGNLDRTKTMDIKNAIYENIVDGFARPGSVATKNHVLIVKTAKLPKPVKNDAHTYTHVDRSIVYKHEEPIIIERDVIVHDSKDAQIAKVKYRSNRPITVGDKLSSRTGNKGIVAATTLRTNMMYSEDGLVPDIYVNAHSIPSRMATNQLLEGVLAMLGVMKGTSIDATIFTEHDIDDVLAELREHGVMYGGHRRMYNGRTGDYLDTLIFVTPNHYQRLEKFVVDEHYAIRTGPTSALSHQPLEGRQHDGGLRLGEMEKDVLCAHGAMNALHDKFYDDSDGAKLYICRRCGSRAVVNEEQNIYRCKNCLDLADIAAVDSSTVANVFMSEMSAMNIGLKFKLDPYVYAKK